jgi:hypothetical protein
MTIHRRKDQWRSTRGKGKLSPVSFVESAAFRLFLALELYHVVIVRPARPNEAKEEGIQKKDLPANGKGK